MKLSIKTISLTMASLTALLAGISLLYTGTDRILILMVMTGFALITIAACIEWCDQEKLKSHFRRKYEKR